CASLADPVPYATPRRDDLSGFVQVVTLQHRSAALSMHRFRPRLHQEELTRLTVLRPFHIHRRRSPVVTRVVVLDRAGPTGEGENLLVREHTLRPLTGRDGHTANLSASPHLVDELELLRSDALLQERPEAL